MRKRKLRFFLDYGICFWGADDEMGFTGGLSVEELPLSLEVGRQINHFLCEYDQHHDWGCPPAGGWTVSDCQRFNREYKRILSLIMPELAQEFILCQEQLDLIEDPALLQEFYLWVRDFVEDRKNNYYGWSENP